MTSPHDTGPRSQRVELDLDLTLVPALHSAVYYHCLAHLEFGADAADLHDQHVLAAAAAVRRTAGLAATRLTRAARELTRRHRRLEQAAPLQVLPLLLEGADATAELQRVLAGEAAPPPLLAPTLAPADGRRFARLLGEALTDELERFFRSDWERVAARLVAEAPRWTPWLREALQQLAAPLFPRLVLELHLCPALRDAGRATTRGPRRVVATAPPGPDEEPSRLLFQVLHELTHEATDPLLITAAAPDTRARRPGFAAHFRLEQGVLAADYHLLRRRRQELLPAYLDWCARWIVPVVSPDAAAALRARAEAAGVHKGAAAWNALARVAAREPRLAAEAALEELLLVPEEALAPLHQRLAERHPAAPRSGGALTAPRSLHHR